MSHDDERIVTLEARIAADAIILPGVEIGEGAVVGAGSVVVKTIDAWMIVGGNPAHQIARRSFNE